MRNLGFLLALGFGLFGPSVSAQTQIIFSKDGSKVSILMMALTKNPDAMALNDALHVKTEEMNGKITKKFKFKDADGIEALSLVCAFSKLVSTTGSCVTVLHPSKGLTADAASSKLSYKVEGTEAIALSDFFLAPANGTVIFHSADNHFVIAYGKDEKGNLSSLSLEYK
jgi:hypothetical protein